MGKPSTGAGNELDALYGDALCDELLRTMKILDAETPGRAIDLAELRRELALPYHRGSDLRDKLVGLVAAGEIARIGGRPLAWRIDTASRTAAQRLRSSSSGAGGRI